MLPFRTRREPGLGTHARSEIAYRLDGKHSRFVAYGGVDDGITNYNEASVVFEVHLDGKRVFRSDIVRAKQDPVPINVELKGAKELKLIVTDAGNGINFDHADWVDAGFIR